MHSLKPNPVDRGSRLSLATAAAADPTPPARRPLTSSYTAAKPIPFQLFRNQRIFLDGEVNGHAAPMNAGQRGLR